MVGSEKRANAVWMILKSASFEAKEIGKLMLTIEFISAQF